MRRHIFLKVHWNSVFLQVTAGDKYCIIKRTKNKGPAWEGYIGERPTYDYYHAAKIEKKHILY